MTFESSTPRFHLQYGIAVMGVLVWIAAIQFIPMVSQMPGMAALLAISLAALTFETGPAVLVLAIVVAWLEVVRPAPSVGVHLQRTLLDAIIGGAVVALAYARQAQARTFRHYAVLFEQHPLPMCVIDEVTGAFLRVNAAACQVYGYSESEFRGRTIDEIRVPSNTAVSRTTGVPAASAGTTGMCRETAWSSRCSSGLRWS